MTNKELLVLWERYMDLYGDLFIDDKLIQSDNPLFPLIKPLEEILDHLDSLLCKNKE